MQEIEYVVQTADTGEFIPFMASDRYEALQKLVDVPIEALYMESKSPDTAFSHTGTYAYHLVQLKDGDYFVLEHDPKPITRDDVAKVYVNVELNQPQQ